MAGEQHTGLTVEWVDSLEGAIGPVVDFLDDGVADRGLLDIDRVIVPNAGVRAWLLQTLSTRVGTGPLGGDGIAMGISVRYVGELDRLIGKPDMGADPWSVGPLAVSLLSVIDSPDRSWSEHARRLGGGLRAARLMADRFDRYHARRPSMIREWEDGRAVLARETDPNDSRLVSLRPLGPDDLWQFDLWSEVRHNVIEAEPWPVVLRGLAADQARLASLELPPRLLVLGLQSLSVHHIELLKSLSTRMGIRVILQHPSPELARRWAAAGGTPVTPGVAPTAKRVEVAPDVDELVGMWLRGSREAQELLTSQDVTVVLSSPADVTEPVDLLDAVKQSVRVGRAVKFAHRHGDPSLQIHRAHNLARQIEIVHDALLHAFAADPDLQPHEVAVLCADIAKASPLLSATFGRTVAASHDQVKIPLIVADRGLREVDEGARLLSDLVAAVSGRFSVADVMSVATNRLVCDRFGVSPADIDSWNRVVERGRVRWGLSAQQRNDSDPRLDLSYEAHTWSAALGRALTGAMLPDAPERVDFGGIVPMPDLEPAEIAPISRLLAVIAVLTRLHSHIHTNAQDTIVGWADLLEVSLVALAGDENADIDDARSFLNTLRGHVTAARGEHVALGTVTFEHFAEQLVEQISSNPGRQSLRTGAVVATSMVPLRGVPFKVVCLVGFDEGVLGAGESEGDDLMARQQFMGDPDPRLDDRRAILDAICAATSRVVITCNGRSIKNNEKLPLITPLAELSDLCERCGAVPIHKKSVVEFMHPRHSSGRRNFEMGGVVPGIVWSHDTAALRAVDGSADPESEAAKLAETVAKRIKREKPPKKTDPVEIDLNDLWRFMRDPLSTYVRGSLGVWIRRSDASDVPAVVPFDVDDKEFGSLSRSWLKVKATGAPFSEWRDTQKSIGSVPPGNYGTGITDRVKGRVGDFEALATAWVFDPRDDSTVGVRIPFAGGEIVGSIPAARTADGRIVVHPFGEQVTGHESTEWTAFLLLVARASGQSLVDFDGGLCCSIGEEEGKEKTLAYPVILDPSITPTLAAARLGDIAALMMRAMRAPFPKFGGTVDALVAPAPTKGKHAGKTPEQRAREEFDVCVAADGRFGTAYSHRNEALVYGPAPKFDAIFGQRSEVAAFHVRLAELLLRQNDELVKDLGLKASEEPPVQPDDKTKKIKGRKRYAYS